MMCIGIEVKSLLKMVILDDYLSMLGKMSVEKVSELLMKFVNQVDRGCVVISK